MTCSTKAVRITKVTNSEAVHGANVAIPLTAAEVISSRFENTLYGYFIVGNPIMLDAYTSSMCQISWGKNDYAGALIEVSSLNPMKDSVVVAIPFPDRSGHSLETVEIEYEWTPPCTSGSFASLLKNSNNPSSTKVVRITKVTNSKAVHGVNVAIPLTAVEVISSRFENTLYGYFIGKRLAFPLVENYVKNAWAKFGLERCMLKKGFFFFQFSTRDGMEKVLESGPWLIRLVPIFLNIWTPNTRLTKETITFVPIRVKLHNIPMGKSNYARALIKVSSLNPMKDSVLVAIPFPDGSGHSLETVEIEYEWTPPWCETCKIFDHDNKECPKNVKVQAATVEEADGFTNVVEKQPNKEGSGISNPILDKPMEYPKQKDPTSSFVPMKNSFETLMNQETDMRNMDFQTATVINDDEEEVENVYDEYRIITGESTPLDTILNNQKPKGEDGILKKIDRVMANIEFLSLFAGACAIFQPYRTWDHAPAILRLPMCCAKKPKPFKFYNLLIQNPLFKDVVNQGWKVHVSGFWMFKVVKRLKYLKKPLRGLLSAKGNIHDKVIKLRHELDEVQKSLDRDPSNVELRDEEAAYLKAFQDAIIDEERFLFQKAKIDWLKLDDANTAYFHKVVKSQASRNRIDSITNMDGNIVDGDQVPLAFINHYSTFLGQPGITDQLELNDLLPNRLSVGDTESIVRDVTNDEIKEALFSLGDNKASGPNGFSVAFFKETWDIISDDVCKVIKEFFTNGILLKELNHTIITLIPKVDAPLRVNDFRLISCCNVLFKCISKIISNRIKGSLADL
nr:hypothetical protein [Tanacetum cinerariifolium]